MGEVFYISDSRQKTDRKLPRTAFKPGQSGNPSGRPKENPEAKEILKAATVEAAKKLVGLLESKNEKIVLTASIEILNRTQGKPRESVDMNLTGGLDVRAQIRSVLLEKFNNNGQSGDKNTDR